MKTTWLLYLTTTTVLLVYVAVSPTLVSGSPGPPRLAVPMTVVQNAGSLGAFCLDGSLPAYNLDRGSGDGSCNWLLQFEGGGWCDSIKSCSETAKSRRGSSRLMTNTLIFSGILSNDPSLNPDFYNWNRVRLRYCDGGSFSGDTEFREGTSLLHFKGQRILQAIMSDLLPKGLAQARNALLTGVSAGGLSTILHCDNFTSYLPKTANVKCMSDAGFFMDAMDVSSNRKMRTFYKNLVTTQDVEKSLDPNCKQAFATEPYLCFFPQNLLKFIKTPLFILDSTYDVHQFKHGLVPPTADRTGLWNQCKANIAACNPQQLDALQGFRKEMLGALTSFYKDCPSGGMFINSCFSHGQSSLQETWLSPNSPRINNKTISATVGDWYFGRAKVAKEIGCPYPCDKTCINLIPAPTTQSLGCETSCPTGCIHL